MRLDTSACQAITEIVVETAGPDSPTGTFKDIAAYWVEASATRWSHAISIEQEKGTALCDTDPLKLHYHYSLVQIGLPVGSEHCGVSPDREPLTQYSAKPRVSGFVHNENTPI